MIIQPEATLPSAEHAQFVANAYLGVGANLGDRLANLSVAAAELEKAGIILLAASPVYETAPWGYADQPAFLNQVWLVKTTLDPLALLAEMKQIEARLGRRPTFRYGPRCIDMDILLYEDIILGTPGLEIPHPRLAERAFVLVPLADLAPDLLHPTLGKTIRQLLARVDCTSVQLYLGRD